MSTATKRCRWCNQPFSSYSHLPDDGFCVHCADHAPAPRLAPLHASSTTKTYEGWRVFGWLLIGLVIFATLVGATRACSSDPCAGTSGENRGTCLDETGR